MMNVLLRDLGVTVTPRKIRLGQNDMHAKGNKAAACVGNLL